MILHCIRHGVTLGNVENRFNGHTEDSITPEQAEALARLTFASSDYDAIYCSPKKRCIETATGLKIANWREEPRIVERHFGLFEGLNFLEAREKYPDHWTSFVALDADYSSGDGESRGAHLARLMHWLEEIAAEHQNVLAITHGGTLDFLYRMGSGAPIHGGGRMHAGENAALSIFEVTWPDVKLIEFSRKL